MIYKEVIALWDSIPELGFSAEFDTEKRLPQFLYKNENLSSVATKDNKIIGGILWGNDGRRGFFTIWALSPFIEGKKSQPNW